MRLLKRKTEKTKEKPKEPSDDVETPRPEKTERHCAVDGCMEEKAPGQTYVCTRHVRTN